MYEARVTRHNPTAFLFLIDQSGSMEEKVTMGTRCSTKANAVAEVTNLMLSEILHRCKRDEDLRDYFDIAVIGYNSDRIVSLLSETNTFVKPSQLAAMDVPICKYMVERIMPNGAATQAVRLYPEWIKPIHKGNTPMYAALLNAYNLANSWCLKKENKGSYPLTIFNITDGDGNDSSPEKITEIASKIKALKTDDGNVLLINIHISATDINKPVKFPTLMSELPANKEAQRLFEMSSIMPSIYNEIVSSISSSNSDFPYRGMCYNSSVSDLLSMINIGSVSLNLIR